jgi:hypothetical protein
MALLVVTVPTIFSTVLSDSIQFIIDDILLILFV